MPATCATVNRLMTGVVKMLEWEYSCFAGINKLFTVSKRKNVEYMKGLVYWLSNLSTSFTRGIKHDPFKEEKTYCNFHICTLTLHSSVLVISSVAQSAFSEIRLTVRLQASHDSWHRSQQSQNLKVVELFYTRYWDCKQNSVKQTDQIDQTASFHQRSKQGGNYR